MPICIGVLFKRISCHNSSPLSVSEGLRIRIFTCLSPFIEFQCSRCFLLLHLLEVPLTALPGLLQGGSGLTNGVSVPHFANRLALGLPAIPLCPGKHIRCTLLCSASRVRDWSCPSLILS
jgi:hypothetical protein